MKTHIRSGHALQVPVISRYPILLFFVILSLCFSTSVRAQEHLFEMVGAPEFSRLPDYVLQSRQIRINRRALQGPTMVIDLFGEQFIAERDRVEREKAGQFVWIGHLQDNELDSVIITLQGNSVSGLIQSGNRLFRLGIGNDKGPRIYEIDVETLPPDDADPLPDGGGDVSAGDETSGAVAGDSTVQDLLVVYNQGACDKDGGCAQLEADIVTAVADINTAYAASGIMIQMNLVGTARTVYTPGTSTQALYDLSGTSDGLMDEIHPLRNELGADLVSFVYNGPGCGIGYLKAGASTAFSVVAVECLVGNRSMAHEIGHNQGAHHDRLTVGTTSTGDYNYGFRRCNDSSVDNLGSPFFRTVLGYPCTNSPRVGRFSNPDILYQGVAQGVDPKVDPARGAWNSRVLNERATTVAGFRPSVAQTIPAAPGTLQADAVSYDTIAVTWVDNADNENAYVLQSSPDTVTWGTIATLAADTTSFQHNGLMPERPYSYRVRAQNSVGSSAYSNIASDTTPARPAAVEDLAVNDRFVAGMVSGTFIDTMNKDDQVEIITEQSSGGSKLSRKQLYSHGWDFDVLGGAGGVVFSVAARVSGSEGANFYYSTDDGSTFHFMFMVANTAAAEMKMFTLPAGTRGPILIQARDSQSVQGEPQDSLFVDYMVVTSYTEAGTPPNAPSGMTVTDITASSVSLQFTDNAENEFGFEILRAQSNPNGDCDAGLVIVSPAANSGTGPVLFTDQTVQPVTDYWYWARAFNGAGDNGECSNIVPARTLTVPAISFSATLTKVKGTVMVALKWSGLAGSMVDIVRNGAIIATVANTGTYSDNTGAKGSGAYSYQVCEAGSTICSSLATVTF